MPRNVDPVYGPRLREVLEGEPLNAREVEILRWAARGLTAVETGQKMFLSHETVKSYRKRASAKLGTSSLTHAVARAIERGVLPREGVSG